MSDRNRLPLTFGNGHGGGTLSTGVPAVPSGQKGLDFAGVGTEGASRASRGASPGVYLVLTPPADPRVSTNTTRGITPAHARDYELLSSLSTAAVIHRRITEEELPKETEGHGTMRD